MPVVECGLMESQKPWGIIFNKYFFLSFVFSYIFSCITIVFKQAPLALERSHWCIKYVGSSLHLLLMYICCTLTFLTIVQLILFFLRKFSHLDALLKMGSDGITSSPCKCSSLLGLTFLEIKKSFTKTLIILILSILE